MLTGAGRLVLDTNVLISAMLQSKGPPRAVLERVRGAGGVLLFCDETFEEVRTRIMRPKFERYVRAELREAFVRDLLPVSNWVSITGTAMGCRDPDDDKFLELVLAGQGDAIVTCSRSIRFKTYRSCGLQRSLRWPRIASAQNPSVSVRRGTSLICIGGNLSLRYCHPCI